MELFNKLQWVCDGVDLYRIAYKAGNAGFKPFALVTSNNPASYQLNREVRVRPGFIRMNEIGRLNLTELKQLQNELKILEILLLYLLGLALLTIGFPIQNRGTILTFLSHVHAVIQGFATSLNQQIHAERHELMVAAIEFCNEFPVEDVRRTLNRLGPNLATIAPGRELTLEYVEHLAVRHGRAALNYLANIFTPENPEE